MKRTVGKLITVCSFVCLVVSATMVTMRLDARPRTDDAFLLADIADIAPDVSGKIIDLRIHANQAVRAGDVLFVIDPEPFQLRVDSSNAQLDLAIKTLVRQDALLDRGHASQAMYDQARSAMDSARAAAALAARDLRMTTVVAPFDGRVIGLNTSVGEYATAGKSLFTMINTSRWFAVANFRETEIAQMNDGASAIVYVMAHPDRPLEGRVESIGWGVLPDDAALVNGVPRVPRALNWVRLAQRFPVRILLDRPSDDLMRLGASAVVVVRRETGH
jgi:membrane fusion protein, multidrug efflux system